MTQTKDKQSHTRETYGTIITYSRTLTHRAPQAKTPRKIMTRTAIIEIAGSIIKQSTSINTYITIQIKTTINLVNPSVTEGKGRMRMLTIGTRAARVIIVDIATKTNK